VSNAWAVRGLDMLAQMMAAGGNASIAATWAEESASLKAAMIAHMWNGSAFCDGVCSEVNGNSRVMSNMFTLAFGMIPEAHVDSVWETVTSWGLEQMGDYGAFFYQAALAGSYYGNPSYALPDDGSALLLALTKCDLYSWCSGLLTDNLTMTRESWHDGTYSHGWGTSPVVGVSWGIMGVRQTSPAFATFTVAPKLGSLSSASITVPTLRGLINVTAGPGTLDVQVPCNSAARLCLPRSSSDAGAAAAAAAVAGGALLLDGSAAPAVLWGGHICLESAVGCGAGGAARQLRLK